MASLGYDTQAYDPLTDKDAVNYLNNWNQEMKAAYDRGELKILKENAEVMWLTTPLKAEFSGLMRTEALGNVTNYIYGDIKTIEKFKESVTNSTWTRVLDEINTTLGK